MFVATVIVTCLSFYTSTFAYEYGAKSYSYNSRNGHAHDLNRRVDSYHKLDGKFGYRYQYGDRTSHVQVSFTSTPTNYQRKQIKGYDQNIASSNQQPQYAGKSQDYVTTTTSTKSQTTSKPVPIYIPSTTAVTYSDSATAYSNAAPSPAAIFENSKQYSVGGHKHSTGTYKVPAHPPIETKEKYLKYENPNDETSFRDLYEYHPDTYRYAHPEKVVPLNVFGLPPKHRFQHPVGNVESSPPVVVHTNAYLPGPVVDSGVTKGSGHREDPTKLHRLYDIHPGIHDLVNPERNTPLNVFGLPPRHRYQSPYGNVNSFRPQEVSTNAYLAGPVVDVTLRRPNLSSSFTGRVPTTGGSPRDRGNYGSQSQVNVQQTVFRNEYNNKPMERYVTKGDDAYGGSISSPVQKSQYYSYTNSNSNGGNTQSNYNRQQQQYEQQHLYSNQQKHEYVSKEQSPYSNQEKTGQQQYSYGGPQRPLYGGQQQYPYSGQEQHPSAAHQINPYSGPQHAYSVEQKPLYSGQQQSSYGGQQKPLYGGQQQSSYSGQHQRSYPGYQRPSYSGEQQSSYGGQQQSSYGGHQQYSSAAYQKNPYSGQQQSSYSGRQQSSYGGQQKLSYGGQQQSAYNNQQQLQHHSSSGAQQSPINSQVSKDAVKIAYGGQRHSYGDQQQPVVNSQLSREYAYSVKQGVSERPYAKYSQGPIRYDNSKLTNQNTYPLQNPSTKDQYYEHSFVNSQYQNMQSHNSPYYSTFQQDHQKHASSYSYDKPDEQYKSGVGIQRQAGTSYRPDGVRDGTYQQDYPKYGSHNQYKPNDQPITTVGVHQKPAINYHVEDVYNRDQLYTSRNGQFVDIPTANNYNNKEYEQSQFQGNERDNSYNPPNTFRSISPVGSVERNYAGFAGYRPKPVEKYENNFYVAPQRYSISRHVAESEDINQHSPGPQQPFGNGDTVLPLINRQLVYQRYPLDHSMISPSVLKGSRRYDRSLDEYFGKENGRIKYDTISRQDNFTSVKVETKPTTTVKSILNDTTTTTSTTTTTTTANPLDLLTATTSDPLTIAKLRSNPDSFLFYNPESNDQLAVPSVSQSTYYEVLSRLNNRRYGYNNRGYGNRGQQGYPSRDYGHRGYGNDGEYEKPKSLLSMLFPKVVKIGLGIGITKEFALVTEPSTGAYYGRGYSYNQPQKGFQVKLGLGPFFEKKVLF